MLEPKDPAGPGSNVKWLGYAVHCAGGMYSGCALRGLHFQPKAFCTECLARKTLPVGVYGVQNSDDDENEENEETGGAKTEAGTSRRNFQQLAASRKTCQPQASEPLSLELSVFSLLHISCTSTLLHPPAPSCTLPQAFA